MNSIYGPPVIFFGIDMLVGYFAYDLYNFVEDIGFLGTLLVLFLGFQISSLPPMLKIINIFTNRIVGSYVTLNGIGFIIGLRYGYKWSPNYGA
ncbi:hypothetical protein J2127_000508 [Methanococcus voltae]|uniref:hypothetical protein n=1 Tax=Methanococcus voltae TaxID=2188 RepID=UPI001AE4B273|nr:hypothetical protein [Methanococcus voltae]MBP2143353.1 hypothetical protein [Methanococcus voltae]